LKQVIILAAGKGTRLLPLTKNTPKPLIEINGKPFLYYFFKNLEQLGFEKVFLVVNYLKEQVEAFVNESDFPFEVILVDQKEAKGTGHAVLIVEPFIQGNFAVINGDNLFSINDLKSLELDDEFSYIYGLEHDHPEKFGVLKTDGEFLTEIIEKPDAPPTNIINAGLYKFTPEIFKALKNISLSSRGEYELPDAIMYLVKQGKVKVKTLQDEYVDLGMPKDVSKVEDYVRRNF